MKKQVLFWLAMLMLPVIGYSQCSTTNATSCVCKDGTTNCDMLPDIIVARPPLLVNGSSGYIEYPQSCPGGCSGNDGRLRLSVSTPNIGYGPLEVHSTTTAICGTDTFYNVASNFTCPNGAYLRTLVNQRVYHKNGNTMTYTDRFAGSMTYHPTHAHMHVDDWGIYTLRTATADPNPLNWPVVGTGSKLAFCLMDYGSCSTYNGHCVDSAGNTLTNGNFPNYGLGGGSFGCSPSVQGISSGYTDIYYQSLDGMWINLPPGLCNGQYWIVVQLDPYNYFLESNENNNVLAVPVTLTQQGGSNPVITASGATTFCQGGSVSLTASSATNYLWSNGATTQSITVSQPGNYSVTVNTGTSCSSTSAATTVTVTQIPVSASANQTSICPGQSVQLTSSATSGGTSNQAVSWSNNTVYSIPDNNATGVSSLITVSGIDPATINSNTVVSVRINITHTYDGDLLVQLVAPSGNAINLSNRRGGSGDNFNNTLFTANAATLISAGTAPFAGTYRPDGAFTSLTGNANGTWTLRVIDQASQDVGTINSWTLTLNDVVPTTLSYNWTSNPAGFTSVDSVTNVNPSVTTTYTVTATESGTGCQGSANVTVTVGNNLNVTTNTPAPICAGASTTLTASGAVSYAWSPSTGLSATTGASVTASPSQTTTYMVIGTDGACSDTAYVTVTVNQIPNIIVSQNTSICEGTSVSLQATGAAILNWSPSTGLNTTAGNFVTASPSGTTTYTVTGSSNGCSGSAQVTVTVNPNPVVSVSGGTTICNGQSTTLTASGASSYSWSPSTGLNQSTGASVDASPAVSTTYTVIGTDVNGCTGSASASITVNNAPFMPTSILGSQNNCLPVNGTYSVNPVITASSYNWTVPSGVSIVTGQGTNSITVSATAEFNGNLCITASNGCGTSQPNCIAINGYTTKPVVPGSMTGPGKACPGDVATYSVAPVTRAVSYNWTAPAGATIQSGQGTTSVIVSFGTGYTGGSLSISASNACGTSGTRSKALALNTPATPGTISGKATGLCLSTQSYTVTNVAGLTYNWSVPAGSTLLSGQGTNSISVQYSQVFSSGNITVTASNNCATSTARVLAVKAAPAIPASISGPASVCKGQTGVAYTATPAYGASTYTWSTNSVKVVIASGQGTTASTVNFDPTALTNAVIRINAGNACGTSSNRTYAVTTTTCPKSADFSRELVTMNVLPNPATEYVEVQFNAANDAKAELRLTNLLGQAVYSQMIAPDNGFNSYMVDLRHQPPGVYIMSITQDGKSFAQRLVIE
ncbi:MAG: proprotein convertase P-domain-containing protein [Bacteroidia bacterium]